MVILVLGEKSCQTSSFRCTLWTCRNCCNAVYNFLYPHLVCLFKQTFLFPAKLDFRAGLDYFVFINGCKPVSCLDKRIEESTSYYFLFRHTIIFEFSLVISVFRSSLAYFGPCRYSPTMDFYCFDNPKIFRIFKNCRLSPCSIFIVGQLCRCP